MDRAEAQVFERVRRNGHHPCLVLQTSPGHFQAWVHVSLPALEPCIATAVARQLARDYGGDLASADGRHVGRLAGFTNQKLIRRGIYGDGPWVRIVYARAGLALQAGVLVKSAMERRRPLWLSAEASDPSGFSIGSTGQNFAPAITAAQATAIYHDCMK